MDSFIILLSTFIALVGVVMCMPSGEIEKMFDESNVWAPSPSIHLGYCLVHVLGIIFVAGLGLYLTFKVHWWYILLYPLGIFIAQAVSSIIIKLASLLSIDKCFNYGMFQAKRLIGIILIITGMASYIMLS